MAKVARGKALVAKLRAQAGVRDPEALAAYLGRFKKARKAGKSVAAAAQAAKGGDSKNGSSKSVPSKPSAPDRPKRTTAAEVEKEPHKYTPLQYQLAKGVAQPHIGEISEVQYTGLSKRGKKQYEDRRNAEWQASADAKREWAEKVVADYKAGKIDKDSPGVSREAKSAMIHSDIADKKRAKAAAEQTAAEANKITSLDEIKKGERLHSPMYGPVEVVRVSGKSARVQLLGRDGQPMKNRDGTNATINIPARLLKAGALKRKK